MAPSTSLAGFVALLRDHGFSLGVSEMQSMLQVALLIGGWREAPLKAAWRAIACQRPREWQQWSELFERYWHPERLRGTVKVSGQTRPRRDLRQIVNDLKQTLSGDGAPTSTRPGPLAGDVPAGENAEESPHAQGGASRVDALDNRQGQLWMAQELGELKRLAQQIYEGLSSPPSRRWKTTARGHCLDLRRTLRRSVAWGGEPLAPAWLVRRIEQPRLFILVDVSRSMESHAAFCLRMARAFARETGARVHVFHTRIADVTTWLQRDSPHVQEKINAVTAGFGGGTRIAACIKDFMASEARGQLKRASRVWICSDGFDTEAPEHLAEALQTLRWRGARIAWFHPTRHAPQATAFKNASKAISVCLPLANLTDLHNAKRHLH